MNNQSFPKLSSFLAAYFSSYWQEEYDWKGNEPSFEAVTKHYKTENPPSIVDQTAEELEYLLKLPLSDSELENTTQYFFNYYQRDGLPIRQVLENLLKVLIEPNNKISLKKFPKIYILLFKISHLRSSVKD